MADRVVVYVGRTLPGVEVTVRDDDGVLVDFSTALSIRFRTRTAAGSAIVVDKAATSPSPGVLLYAPWAAIETQVGTQGEYRGWFTVTWPGNQTQDTDEVSIDIEEHAPLAAAGAATGPCTPWITADDVSDYCQAGGDLAVFARAASEVMFELSGRQFTGLCTSTVRPCRQSYACCLNTWGTWSTGRWACSPPIGCGCGTLSEVMLPGYPVRAITSVKIDNVALAANSYRVDTRDRVVRLSGFDPWPACQDLSVEATAVGSFVIEYTHGADPPAIGLLAARELACQLAKAANGDDCQLPSGVTKVTRQGVTFDRGAIATALGSGMSGIVAIDAFLAAHNPARQRRRPAVWSPESARYARRV